MLQVFGTVNPDGSVTLTHHPDDERIGLALSPAERIRQLADALCETRQLLHDMRLDVPWDALAELSVAKADLRRVALRLYTAAEIASGD